MYSPVAISDARRLAATPYRLFGARRPVARVCHPPGSPPQRWSIHTGAVSRQCSSAGFSHAVKTPSCPIACQSVRLTTCVVLFDADQSDVRGGIMGFKTRRSQGCCSSRRRSSRRQLQVSLPLEDHRIPQPSRASMWSGMVHTIHHWPHPIAPPCDLHAVLTAVSWACVPCPVHVHVLLRRCCD